MSELSKDEARRAVATRLSSSPLDIVILDDHTISKPWGWVFFYENARYLETNDFSEKLVGNAPYIVNRYTGEIRATGTAKPVEDYIKEYETNLQNGGA